MDNENELVILKKVHVHKFLLLEMEKENELVILKMCLSRGLT